VDQEGKSLPRQVKLQAREQVHWQTQIFPAFKASRGTAAAYFAAVP
jgi:hypothetical protein